MIELTLDQLSYILERKYINCSPGEDFVLTENVEHNPETGRPEPQRNAQIREWHMEGVDQPSDEYLQRLWERLKEEYHGRPNREDSEMAQFMAKRNPRKITINEEL